MGGTSNPLPPNMAAEPCRCLLRVQIATAAASACVLIVVGAAAAAVSTVVTKGCSTGQSLAASGRGTAVGREGYTYTVDEHHVGCRVGAAALPCAACSCQVRWPAAKVAIVRVLMGSRYCCCCRR